MSARNTLANIRIVLIQTSHPGNIGSAARAMKTMGLSELYLVNPKSFPDDQAVAMSSNAADILNNAHVVDTLQEAIADCQLVVGSSARHERSLKWDILDSRSCGELVAKQAKASKVAILFGRESSGLSNEELALCRHLVHIPTNPDYSSLNVASAVQILGYECRIASLKNEGLEENHADNANADPDDAWITAKESEGYFEHLQSILIELDFLDPDNPRYLMPRLRRLYSRSGITRSELNILRGMLTAIQKRK